MQALKELSRLALELKQLKYPLIPLHALVKPKYTDKDANSLTKAIIDYFRLIGGYAVRINSQGQYNTRLGKFTKGQTTKGTADIHALLNGIHYSIEVKIGKDRLSKYQLTTQEKITAAGGLYFVATDFQTFYNWITSKKKEVQNAE